MGLIVSVYRDADIRTDCTNGGISSRFTRLCVVNASGPFDPTENAPAVILQNHVWKCLRIVPAVYEHGMWRIDEKKNYMFGGNYASTSDSRFGELCRKLLNVKDHGYYDAVAIHDRVEW